MGDSPDILLKQCSRCREFLPFTNFYRNAKTRDGFQTACKSCLKIPKDILPPVPEGMKRCTRCKNPLLLANFCHDKTKRDGYHTICKKCTNAHASNRGKDDSRIATPQSPIKVCRDCLRELDATLDNFSFNKATSDHLRARCKSCENKRQKEWYASLSGQKHTQTYVKNHRDARIIYRRQYHKGHRDEELAYKNRYHAKNKERELKYAAEYRRTEHGRLMKRIGTRIRYARMKQAPGTYTAQQIREQYQRQHGRCYYCKDKFGKGKNAYHIDHIIPLSRGGSNDMSNIVLACASCNTSKSDKLLHEWKRNPRLL